MRKAIEHLLALQKLQFDARSRTAKSQAEMQKLREEVPASLLAHYDRLGLRGKKGVAVARNGVCSECHLCITRGRLISMANVGEVQVCDNCGRYLYLPDVAPVGVSELKPLRPAAVKRAPRRKAEAVA